MVILHMPYPVLRIVDELKHQLSQHSIVILQAPPGAGKSTVIPLQLLEEHWLEGGKMIMLEPRRLAAKSVAMRMANMMQQDIGKTVGYRVRFDSKVSHETKIEVVTEGILTRLIQNDNSLEGIQLIIFDEFHERSLHADTALALSLQVQQVLRPDLKILIMSATIDTGYLSTLLGNAPVVKSEGKQFPVTLKYVPGDDADISRSVTRVIKKAFFDEAGDILVFLPGAYEITKTFDLISRENLDAGIFALYGDLPFKKQQEALLPDPSGRRKIILSTSIAETSLTIEGVGVVVDSGLSRIPKFDPRSGFTRLETVKVTKDAADQRAGRAGRLGPGVCYRLWSEGSHASLVAQRSPEILEADLAPLALELAQWGIKETNELTWITPPPPGAYNQALELLNNLEALKGSVLTAKGSAMLKLPTHPRIAHMMLEATAMEGDKAIALAADMASIIEEKDPLDKSAGVDLSLRVEILRSWRNGEKVNADKNVFDRIEKLASSWRKVFKVNVDNNKPDHFLVGLLLLQAFPERLAKQVENFSPRYKLLNGRFAKLHDHDPLLTQRWLAVSNLDAGLGEGRIFLAAPVSESDLLAKTSTREVVRWDDNRGSVTGIMERHIGIHVVQSRPLNNISDDLRVKALCNYVSENGLKKTLSWKDEHDQWQARVMSLKHWRKEEQWPDVSDEKLLDSINEWLTPFLTQASKSADLLKIDLMSALNNILPWELQQKLNSLAPLRMNVPSGSDIKIQYNKEGNSPVMEVRLQEVFGLLETPSVNDGRNKIVLHLLSPGFKPVQVTQDLKSFWSNTYAEVRKELRMRYPKHSWPEDPWTAEAVRGVKRRAN